MNKAIPALFAFLFLFSKLSAADGSFKVMGTFDKFYPVTFYDNAWIENVPTELTIGRSSVHTDAQWRGSVMGVFKFHVSDWGNGSQFIDADIKQYSGTGILPFIAGWRDGSYSSSARSIIIWLRGGGTTYYYHSNYQVNPTVYDQSDYQEPGGQNNTYKTAVDQYVNNAGISNNFTAFFNGPGTNYFGGSIGIGTYDAKGYKLAVNGNAVFTKVVVKAYPSWPDYVFRSNYRLRPLSEVEQYLKQHHHLPEVPSAEEVEKSGMDVGDNQATLLKKIEELTLYVIEQQKSQQKLDQRVNALEQENEQLKKILNKKM